MSKIYDKGVQVHLVCSEGSVGVKGLPWDIVENNRLAILARASF